MDGHEQIVNKPRHNSKSFPAGGIFPLKKGPNVIPINLKVKKYTLHLIGELI